MTEQDSLEPCRLPATSTCDYRLASFLARLTCIMSLRQGVKSWMEAMVQYSFDRPSDSNLRNLAMYEAAAEPMPQ